MYAVFKNPDEKKKPIVVSTHSQEYSDYVMAECEEIHRGTKKECNQFVDDNFTQDEE